MKLSRSAALAILLISSCAGIALAQPQSVGALRQQIADLERMSASGDAPAAFAASTGRLLAIKRAQLGTSLRMQLDALRKYQESYGQRFTARESRNVAESIRTLENELQSLGTVASGPKERGHAEKAPRPQFASPIRAPAPVNRVPLKPAHDPNFMPRRIDEEFLAPSSPKTSEDTEAGLPTRNSQIATATLSPIKASMRTVAAINAAAPALATNNIIPVYWDSSRTGHCPAAATEPTLVTFRLTGINDLLVDFDQNKRLVYRLVTKKYSKSQIPPDQLWAFNARLGSSGRTKAATCPTMTNASELISVLQSIRQSVQQNPYISPDGDGGRSISLDETRNAALGISNVNCVLGLIAETPRRPFLNDPQVTSHPVYRWINLIDGPHSIDLKVTVEAEYNYDFRIEERWGNRPTDDGTIKINCGERDLFTLSLGPVVSTLPSRTYNHQKAPVPPGGSTTQDILVVGNSRNINVLGAALLNYHLPRINWFPSEMGIALSAGPVYTLGSTPEVSALGLFVGTSFHLNRSIFITPGVHIGEFGDFPAGFAPGSIIPNQFGDLNPVKRRTAKFAIGLTYKTASFKKSDGNGEASPPPENGNGNGDGGTSGSEGGTSTSGSQGSGTTKPPDDTQPTTPTQPVPGTPTPTPVQPRQTRRP